jgi:hypothetical protein
MEKRKKKTAKNEEDEGNKNGKIKRELMINILLRMIAKRISSLRQITDVATECKFILSELAGEKYETKKRIVMKH